VIVNFQHETWYQDEKLYTMKAEEGFLCRVAFLAGFHVHRLRVSSKAGILAQLLRVGQMVVATIGSGVASCAKKTSGNFWFPAGRFRASELIPAEEGWCPRAVPHYAFISMYLRDLLLPGRRVGFRKLNLDFLFRPGSLATYALR
jgi:hypothetical protein